jgi:hypothetical protein
MKTMTDFIPDCNKAKDCLSRGIFNEYSAAFVVTNESLRMAMEFLPVNCERALVVAASGDHPLFCSLYGAKHVDTFDISYNAKCIMDIKTAAVECLDYSEYLDLLVGLSNNCRDVARVPNMNKISKNLSSIEFKYLCSMKGYRLFLYGIQKTQKSPVLPTESEYQKLQEIVNGTYSFTMTDITNLNGKLTQSYDFMHFSNVFDHIRKPQQHFTIIEPLLKHVNVGGRVLIQQFCRNHCNDEAFSTDIIRDCFKSGVLKDWRFTKISDDGVRFLNVFERVR